MNTATVETPSFFGTQFFAHVASLSETALMACLAPLTQYGDLAALSGFLDYLEHTGSERLDVGVRRSLSVKRQGESDQDAAVIDTFGALLIQAIATPRDAPMGRPVPLTSEQNRHLDRVIAIGKAHSEKNWFLNTMLHQAASSLRDPSAFLRLTAAGAATHFQGASHTLPSQEMTDFFGEAMACGNTVALCAVFEHIETHTVPSRLKAMAQGGREHSLPGSSVKDEIQMLAKLAQTPEDFLAPLGGGELMEKLAGMMRARDANQFESFQLALLTHYLRASCKAVEGALWSWDEGVVKAILAPSKSSLDDCAMAKKLRACPTFDSIPIHLTHLLHDALVAHCYPLLAIAGTSIAVEMDAYAPVLLRTCLAVEDGARGLYNAQDAERLRGTLAVLMAQGYPVEQVGVQPSILFKLAKTREFKMMPQRLAVLLGLGSDPDARDILGMTAASEVPAMHRQAWFDVCNSFKARNNALAILSQIEAQTAAQNQRSSENP